MIRLERRKKSFEAIVLETKTPSTVWLEASEQRLVLMRTRAGSMSDSSENLLPPLSCCVVKSQGQQEMRWITLLTLTGPQDTPWKTTTVSTDCWLFKWAGNRLVWVVLLTSRWQRWWWWEGEDGDRCSAVTSILSHLWVNMPLSLFSVHQPCSECSLVNS